MERWLGKYSDVLYALLRIVAGLLFAFHGADKLFGTFGGAAPRVPMMMIAGVVELGGGLLIALGVFTSIVAFIAAGEMAAAFFIAHLPKSFWPYTNGGELAVLYCFVFLYIASVGTGRFGLMSGKRTP